MINLYGHSPVITALRDAQTTFINVFNDKRVRNITRITFDILDAVKAVKHPTPVSIAWAAAKVAVSLVENLEVDEYVYFESSEEWFTPFSRDFSSIIIECLAKRPTRVLQTSDKGVMIHVVSVCDDDAEALVGWVNKDTSSGPPTVWARSSRRDKIVTELSDMLWKTFENDSIVITKTRHRGAHRRSKDTYEDTLTFMSDSDSTEALPSVMARQYSQHLQNCVDEGVSRTVLFYGPPGTGKSTMVQTIVKTLQMKSFRINVANLPELEQHTLYESISIFKPDVVIIDDIDRCHHTEMLWDVLSHFKRHVKLMLATANKRSSMDEGLLRPGRFDELIPVTKLDEDVIRHVLGPRFQDVFEDVKDWPIAYIEEYKIRRRLMPAAQAKASMAELHDRVKRLRNYYNEVNESNEEEDEEDEEDCLSSICT